MRIDIELNENDTDLEIYFNKVDEPARPFVVKQLIRVGLNSGVNPFFSPVKQELQVSSLPEFEYKEESNLIQNEKKKLQEPPVTKKRELTKEEKLNILKKNLGKI